MYLESKKYLPIYDAPVYIKTTHGQIRKGYYYGLGCFHFTDCTHPLQNVNCPYFYTTEWKYQDPAILDFQVNHVEHSIQGEEILRSVFKRKTIIQRILKIIGI